MEARNKYQNAVSIVRRLKEKGYESYFVGGWVRDKLLGIVNENTEIDIATSCPVQKIPAVFKDYKHEYVGMAFGVCIVKIKGFAEEEFIEEILACGDDGLGNPISKYSKETKKRKKYVYFSYDIATFRRDGVYLDGRKPNGIEIKSVSVEEDAKRRDFTINALYYDPVGVCRCLTASDNVRYDHDCGVWRTKDRILDFVGGQEDLKDRIIRAVGNPRERFKEDKLRMIRAVRLQFQLNKHFRSSIFRIEDETEQAIKELSNELLPAVSYERIWQELDKASKFPDFFIFFSELDRLGLLVQFFPKAKEWNGIWWEDFEDVLGALPQNTPTLIKIMAMLGTFEKDEVLKIVKRFGLKKPNWIE